MNVKQYLNKAQRKKIRVKKALGQLSRKKQRERIP